MPKFAQLIFHPTTSELNYYQPFYGYSLRYNQKIYRIFYWIIDRKASTNTEKYLRGRFSCMHRYTESRIFYYTIHLRALCVRYVKYFLYLNRLPIYASFVLSVHRNTLSFSFLSIEQHLFPSFQTRILSHFFPFPYNFLIPSRDCK